MPKGNCWTPKEPCGTPRKRRGTPKQSRNAKTELRNAKRAPRDTKTTLRNIETDRRTCQTSGGGQVIAESQDCRMAEWSSNPAILQFCHSAIYEIVFGFRSPDVWR